MPRHARLDTPGTLHHVIVREIKKRRIVDDRWDRDTTAPFTIPAYRQAGLLEPRVLSSCANSPGNLALYAVSVPRIESRAGLAHNFVLRLLSPACRQTRTPPCDDALLRRHS